MYKINPPAVNPLHIAYKSCDLSRRSADWDLRWQIILVERKTSFFSTAYDKIDPSLAQNRYVMSLHFALLLDIHDQLELVMGRIHVCYTLLALILIGQGSLDSLALVDDFP